jgi:hypothetical protein
MPGLTLIQPSFSAGELAPNLFGRIDVKQYKIAAATMRNFFPDYRGGASNRAGTQYCDTLGTDAAVTVTSYNPRLIPFIIGVGNAFVMVLGTGYAKFYQNGLPYSNPPVVTPYALADVFNIKFTQSASVMTLTHPNYPPQNITLSSAGVFTIAPSIVSPEMNPPGAITATPPATTNPDYCYCYVVTAVSEDGKRESLPSPPVLVHYTIQDETKGFIIPLTWIKTTSNYSVYRVYKSGPYDDRVSTGPGTSWGFIGDSQTPTFTDLNIAPDFSQQPPQWGDPFDGGQFLSIGVSGGGGGYPSGGGWTGYIPLTITDATGSGAVGYATTSYAGVVTGAFMVNPGKNYSQSPTITAGGGGATFTKTISPYSTSDATKFNYPTAASYIQQRQVFGGSNAKPETLNFTQTGDYGSFSFSPASQPNDGIVVDIATTQVNTIQAFQPVSLGLLAFTTGSLFLISGGPQGSGITPSTVTAQTQIANGINNLPPLPINYSVLYGQNRGNVIRDASFAWQRQSYVGTDISVFSNHLFTGYSLLDWTWAEEPHRLVWATRNDGILLSLTYVPDQDVLGWARHDTQGLFVSVCSVPEGNRNITYVICIRQINGTFIRTLERFDDRIFDDFDGAGPISTTPLPWFVDCGLESAITNSSNCGTPTANVFMVLEADGTAQLFGAPIGGIVVGDVFWAKGGKGIVTTLTPNPTLQILQPFPHPANYPAAENVQLIFRPGEWEYAPNVTTAQVGHLPNTIVTGLVDGVVIPPTLTDNTGHLNLPVAGSKVVVGLGYQSQLKTLPLTTGPEAVSEGKRKIIPAITVRVDDTLGLKAGPDFDTLYPIPDLAVTITPPPQFFSGDARILLNTGWIENGQYCFQQDDPLPVTILAVIPEVTLGDDQQ